MSASNANVISADGILAKDRYLQGLLFQPLAARLTFFTKRHNHYQYDKIEAGIFEQNLCIPLAPLSTSQLEEANVCGNAVHPLVRQMDQ